MNIRAHFFILSLGFDTAKGDLTGTWSPLPRDFKTNGRMIGSMRILTVFIQEGGYRIRSLAVNARNFLIGLWEGGIKPAKIEGSQPDGRNEKNKGKVYGSE